MKKVFVILGLSVLFSGAAHALFPMTVNVSVSPQFVQATACNYEYNFPIVCHTTAYGEDQFGQWVSYWANLPLQPGQCEDVYVYATGQLYFIDGRGTASCDEPQPGPQPYPGPGPGPGGGPVPGIH